MKLSELIPHLERLRADYGGDHDVELLMCGTVSTVEDVFFAPQSETIIISDEQ